MLKNFISKNVWDYIQRTGFQFSDAEIAAIIYHSGASVAEKHQAFQSLADHTEDMELRQEITERIAYDRMLYDRFVSNDGSYFYDTCSAETTGHWDRGDVTGHFTSVELALAHAKSLGPAFFIRKYQIIGLCKNVIVRRGHFNPKLCPDATDVVRAYRGDAIAGFFYDSNGELKDFWSFELTDEEESVVEDWGTKRFEWKYFQMPNPFEKGDTVRCIMKGKVGAVATSQEDWSSYLQRAEARKHIMDFSDASIVVEFPDGSHDHFQPVYLERVVVAEGDEPCSKDKNKTEEFEENDPHKTYYDEDVLSEEFKNKIGMISLNVPNQYILLPVEFWAYTIDGNSYEITPAYQYWKELLKSEYGGDGNKGPVFELEHEGWKKYFSKKLLTYYLIAPDFVDEAARLIGEKDIFYALKEIDALFMKGAGTRYYSRKGMP